MRKALERGHTATVIAAKVAPDLVGQPNLRWIHPPGMALPTSLLKTQVFSAFAHAALRRRRHEFDIVNINGSCTIAASDVNSVHFVHGSWLRSAQHTRHIRKDAYGIYHGLLTVLHHQQERAAFQRSRKIVAVSRTVADQLMDIGVPAAKIHVILNGVDVNEFHPGTFDRAELGLPIEGFLAFFAGDIKTPRKNLETVLRSLRETAGVHLVVAGTTQNSPYPAMARELGLADRVTFLGFRADMAALMRACDVFVFPSRYEPYGLVILEAMSSGIPVITARVVGAAEIITDDTGTVLDDPDDVTGLAFALGRYANDQMLRRQAGAAARRVAMSHTWSTMADQYLDLFETLRP